MVSSTTTDESMSSAVAGGYKRLAYISDSVQAMSPEELDTLLEKARVRNREKGISGILFYLKGCFFQFIEGPAAAIDQLYRNLLADGRHDNVRLVYEQSFEVLVEGESERIFRNWAMAYQHEDMLDVFIRERLDVYIDRETGSGEFAELKDLLEFMASVNATLVLSKS
ncbi:MAG: BLUF domain-containing protein [Zetaproteobacteria bacterium]|nr:BLUF domain-containing protein [Zetaproteobacteria bacterium]